MHQEPTAISSQNRQSHPDPDASAENSQHGFLRNHCPSPHGGIGGRAAPGEAVAGSPGPRLSRRSSVTSTSSRSLSSSSSSRSIDVGRLERLLPALCGAASSDSTPIAVGQRVLDYENALPPGASNSQSMLPGPRTAVSPPNSGKSLSDFPNEILANIFSHMHPESLPALALVSKRFHALVTSPYAWRMAFFRQFPGPDADRRRAGTGVSLASPGADLGDTVRSETRAFGRLTANATWRSEYLLRTRLLRSLARARSGRGSRSTGDRGSGVLTYGTKVPWRITHLDASFSNRRSVARALHGAADLGICTASDPTSGKVEKWGIEDQFATSQLNEMFPNTELYGLGDGPAIVPNVMDISQDCGIVTGEGFPGGRVYFRASGERTGFLLGQTVGTIGADVPAIPTTLEGISSVWIAKSGAVPSATDSMIGVMTGSTLGVVTAYSLIGDRGVSYFSNGDMTARWVICPGVPIVCLQVDNNYSVKRKNSGRTWAVALNALGEVYCLKDAPGSRRTPTGDDILRNAWISGRSVSWNLVEATRRRPNPESFVPDPVAATKSPKSSSDAHRLTQDQLESEAREIEVFLCHQPSYFRSTCVGWDMRRKLEVDFGGDDERGGGEAVFVFDCGYGKDPARVCRYVRLGDPRLPGPGKSASLGSGNPNGDAWPLSLFASPREGVNRSPINPVPAHDGLGLASDALTRSTTSMMTQPPRKTTSSATSDDWLSVKLKLHDSGSLITASALDTSNLAHQTLAEDPSAEHDKIKVHGGMTPRTAKAESETPGRRARLLAIGLDNGIVLVWDARATTPAIEMEPLRVIRTDSPEISCLAVSALYVVHGGSDGLAQAWDPLASTVGPIKTLTARSAAGHVPRQLVPTGLVGRTTGTTSVGAIYLDPNPTALRGIVAFGPIVRSWSYSSGDSFRTHKRKSRRQHGDIPSRRLNKTVAGHIATEERELRREQKNYEMQEARLRSRFGVGMGDLTEEEAVLYAQMVSEDTFLVDKQRRYSPIMSRQSSPAIVRNDSSSSSSSSNAVWMASPRREREQSATPCSTQSGVVLGEEVDFELQIQRAVEVSLLGTGGASGSAPPSTDHTQSPRTPSPMIPRRDMESDYDGEFEFQMQRALKLSLVENGPANLGQASAGFRSGDYECAAEYTIKTPKKGKRSPRVTSHSAFIDSTEASIGHRSRG